MTDSLYYHITEIQYDQIIDLLYNIDGYESIVDAI